MLGPRHAGLAGRTRALAPPPSRTEIDDALLGGSYQRLAESYERQIRSARSRGDTAEVNRIRSEYEAFLEGWRANEELARAVPEDLDLDQARSFTEQERQRVGTLLAASEGMSSSLPGERLVRANALCALGRYQDALEGYDRLIGYLHDQHRLQHQRGYCLSKLGAWEQARNAFELSLEADPDDPAALRGKGVALLGLDRPEEALVSLGRSLERAPERAETHFQMGEALWRLARPEAASAAYERALERVPSEPRYLHRYARSLVQLGLLDQAIEAFDQAFDQHALNAGDPIEHLRRMTAAVSSDDHRHSIPPERADPQFAPSNDYSSRGARGVRHRRRRNLSGWFYLAGIVLAFLLSVVLNDFLRELRFRQRLGAQQAERILSSVERAELPEVTQPDGPARPRPDHLSVPEGR